jgi:hypothetical protein
MLDGTNVQLAYPIELSNRVSSAAEIVSLSTKLIANSPSARVLRRPRLFARLCPDARFGTLSTLARFSEATIETSGEGYENRYAKTQQGGH